MDIIDRNVSEMFHLTLRYAQICPKWGQKLRGNGSKMGFWKCCRGVDRKLSETLFLVHFSLIFGHFCCCFPGYARNVDNYGYKCAKVCPKYGDIAELVGKFDWDTPEILIYRLPPRELLKNPFLN